MHSGLVFTESTLEFCSSEIAQGVFSYLSSQSLLLAVFCQPSICWFDWFTGRLGACTVPDHIMRRNSFRQNQQC